MKKYFIYILSLTFSSFSRLLSIICRKTESSSDRSCGVKEGSGFTIFERLLPLSESKKSIESIERAPVAGDEVMLRAVVAPLELMKLILRSSVDDDRRWSLSVAPSFDEILMEFSEPSRPFWSTDKSFLWLFFLVGGVPSDRFPFSPLIRRILFSRKVSSPTKSECHAWNLDM